MKVLLFAIFFIFPFFTLACTEAGFTKVFECQDDYPYFSKITHRCYASEAELKAAEKEDASASNKPSKTQKDDDEDDEEEGRAGSDDEEDDEEEDDE